MDINLVIEENYKNHLNIILLKYLLLNICKMYVLFINL